MLRTMDRPAKTTLRPNLDLGVGGIDHEQVHAGLAQLGELPQVSQTMIQRQRVDLHVAGVDDVTRRSAHRDGQGIRNGVGDRHELQVEGAHFELVAALDLNLRGLKMMLLALGVNEPQGQLGADQGDVRTQLEQIWHAADVVLMPMSQHQGIHLIQLVLDVAEVGQNQIHARLLLLREEHATVDQQNVAVVLDHIHIATDLPQTPQGDDTHGALTVLGRRHQTLLGLCALAASDGAVAAVAGFAPGPA